MITVKFTIDVADCIVKLAEDYANMITKDDETKALIYPGVVRNR